MTKYTYDFTAISFADGCRLVVCANKIPIAVVN